MQSKYTSVPSRTESGSRELPSLTIGSGTSVNLIIIIIINNNIELNTVRFFILAVRSENKNAKIYAIIDFP